RPELLEPTFEIEAPASATSRRLSPRLIRHGDTTVEEPHARRRNVLRGGRIGVDCVGSPRWAGSTLCARNPPRLCGSGVPDRTGVARARPGQIAATRAPAAAGARSG